MHRSIFRFYRTFLIPVLTGSLLLSGCFHNNKAITSPTAAPFEDTPSQSYENFEEQQLIVQKNFDQLTHELFLDNIREYQLELHCLLKDPSAYGIQKADHLYPSFTDDTFLQNQKDREELDQELSSFDPGLLQKEQRRTLRILKSYLKTEALGDGLEYYAQPLAPTIGIQAQLPILLSEYRFYNRQDIDQYLELLEGIDEYYSELMEFERKKAAAGLMISDSGIDRLIESCQCYLPPSDINFMSETFEIRLNALEELSPEERESYIQKNNELLTQDFNNAYQILIKGLTELKGSGTNEGGQCGYPRGKEFYEYLVRSATGTSFQSMEELLKHMELTMNDSIQTTSRLLRDHPELADQINTYEFRLKKPEEIMEELKLLSQNEYPALPECQYSLHTIPQSLENTLSPAFYLLSPIDDYQNNHIYINQNPRYSSNSLFTTMAHEGYPGHLYQNVYFNTHCDSNIRYILSFPGYSEGWATYTEYNIYRMTDDISPELGELLAANDMATLGLSACLDVYINYMGWDRNQVKEYLKNFQTDSDQVVDAVYNAIVDNPSNYLSYYVGCMEIRSMRDIAEKELGDRYDQKAFHTFLLDFGPAPFDVIQPYFTSWLKEQKSSFK